MPLYSGVAITMLALLLEFAISSSTGHGCFAGEPAPKPRQSINLTPAYTAYINRLRGKVQNVWNYPDGKNQVVLQATVGLDGSVGEVVLKSTPNNADAEQAASTAFAQAQPLERLPAGSAPIVRVTLTFDSIADPHGDSKISLSGRLDPVTTPKSSEGDGQEQAH
ncbi:MAG: TonB C-terminal domain-containing protein [Candidatus Melainabacteria bacterium]|nr:TonB C-terminal domain-containing protein [Candidatus Melainabacteria bacterium]